VAGHKPRAPTTLPPAILAGANEVIEQIRAWDVPVGSNASVS
jgi:hypothetical protein